MAWPSLILPVTITRYSNVDSSIAGLGGCPYAKGASGNVSTEDLYYLLSKMGFETGIQLDTLMQTSRNISEVLQRNNPSIMPMPIGKSLCLKLEIAGHSISPHG